MQHLVQCWRLRVILVRFTFPLQVSEVSDVTGVSDMLDGRVKTLHPKIHAGILAIGCQEHLDELKEAGIEKIDVRSSDLNV